MINYIFHFKFLIYWNNYSLLARRLRQDKEPAWLHVLSLVNQTIPQGGVYQMEGDISILQWSAYNLQLIHATLRLNLVAFILEYSRIINGWLYSVFYVCHTQYAVEAFIKNRCFTVMPWGGLCNPTLCAIDYVSICTFWGMKLGSLDPFIIHTGVCRAKSQSTLPFSM